MAQTLNISQDTMGRIASMVVGCRVDRAAAILANVNVLFTVAGGSIVLTGFYGEIMVAIDAANNLTLTYDADVSANASVYVDTVLGSASGDINTYVAGRMLYLPAIGGALTVGTGGSVPMDVAPTIVLPPGHFDMASTGTSTLGTIRWSMWYIPIDAGAYVVSN